MAADKKEAKKAANSLFQLGNSAEVIAQLEKDYDFSGVGVKEHEQAQKWYMATQPSRSYGPDVLSAYYMWLRWNLTSNGKPSPHYKGDLVRKREEGEEEEEESEEEEEGGLFKFTRVGGDG